MEKFSYNHQVLLDIMNQHRLTKRDVLNVLGTKDYSSLTRWMDNQNPVPVESILKLCNKYDVSPAQWFLHNGEPETMEIRENPYQVTKIIAGDGMVSETEFLKMQLAHAQEVNEIERLARQREDQIRRDCQIAFDKERSRLMDLIERQNNEIIKHQRNHITSGYRVAEEDPENIVEEEINKD